MTEQAGYAGREHESVSGLPLLAARIAGLAGWRRAAAAFGLGAVACAALPPFDIVIALVPAFCGLLWLIAGCRSTKSAYWTGWWFGLGLFVPGLYWIANAMMVDVARFWWAVPFALIGLPAVIGWVYIGPVAALLHRSRTQGLAQVLIFAGLWAGAEYLRGYLFTGFPWNLIGYGWDAVAPMRQSAAWIGAYGVSLFTVLAASTPAALVDPTQPTEISKTGLRGVLAAALGLIAIAAAGEIRLAGATDATVPGVMLRLVQPNIEQTLKWDPHAAVANFRKIIDLSRQPSTAPLSAILWPESATAFLVGKDPGVTEAIKASLSDNHLLLTGTARESEHEDGTERWSVGMIALDGDAKPIATYDKFHLVPFGEYVPYKSILPIQKLTPGAAPFEPGPGPRTLDIPGLPPVGPLICFEAIFPGEVVDEANRPQWLFNMTNDAWYGYSTGPFQHFVQSAWRGIEEGLPVVRVANTGISGVVDPYGRVIARLGLEEMGVIDSKLPVALKERTLYARVHDWPVFAAIAVLLIAGERLRRARRI